MWCPGPRVRAQGPSVPDVAMPRRRLPWGRPGFFALFGLILAGCGDRSPEVPERALRAVELLRVEDTRPSVAEAGPLLDALSDPEPGIRFIAVRALGRLETTEYLDDVQPLLDDPEELVRATAYNAVAQMAFGERSPEVHALLGSRIESGAASETPAVRGVIGRSFGRLELLEDEDPAERARTVLSLTGSGEGEALSGVLLGLYYLQLASDGEALEAPELRERVAGWTADADVEVRKLAAMTLAAEGGEAPSGLVEMIDDAEPAVRRAALQMLDEGQADLALAALQDPDHSVRIEALRALWGMDEVVACERSVQSLMDDHHLVRMVALDLLSRPCEDAGVRMALVTLASSVQEMPAQEWQAPIAALEALSAVSPRESVELIGLFLDHPDPFARAHVAVAAARAGDEGTLRRLAGDPDPNIRTAAVTGLYSILGHRADEVLIAQLSQSDPQLVLTAAQRLSGSPIGAEVVEPAFDALARLSAERRETFRDPRMELVERIGEFGGAGHTSRLEPYLTDYDPAVAEAVAGVLSEWSGEEVAARPQPASGPPFPTAEEIARLRNARVVLDMGGDRLIVISLLPDEAPTNAVRFARLAESGHFDGLTFHRIVPNFIIQGGSPGANEYLGDGPFTRDELGLRSHWRGTVGLSTRGRDTGDGQIFINTVDNLRLDHNYTIFGVVDSGMEHVDGVREGDVIVSASVLYD